MGNNCLILGTAQLGSPYGIANTIGQPTQAQANMLVRTALEGGVTCFDTAQAYGHSEYVLGAALSAANATESARVITKLAPVLPTTYGAIEESLADSLARIHVPYFQCVMLHREEQIPLLDSYVGTALTACRDAGMLRNIGVSVYTPAMALAALHHPAVSVVQIPASLADRRFECAGIFDLAAKIGKEVHIRSVFLQGSLLMSENRLPPWLSMLRPYIAAIHDLAALYDVTPACLSLGWICQRFPDAKVLFGAESVWQVRENINYMRQAALLPADVWHACDAIIPPQTAELLNPALWKK